MRFALVHLDAACQVLEDSIFFTFWDGTKFHDLPTYPPYGTPAQRNKGLIAGLIKGNQWLVKSFNKAIFLGGGYLR